jgi:hypothetical protein
VKAWSLWQPWASLWLSPCKIHETRSWPLNYRGPLLVHATKHIEFKSVSPDLEDILDSEFGPHWGTDLPRGALIGLVEVVDCVRTVNAELGATAEDVACGDWTPGRYAIKRSPVVKKFAWPIPYRGKQRNPFDVSDEIVREALAA